MYLAWSVRNTAGFKGGGAVTGPPPLRKEKITLVNKHSSAMLGPIRRPAQAPRMLSPALVRN